MNEQIKWLKSTFLNFDMRAIREVMTKYGVSEADAMVELATAPPEVVFYTQPPDPKPSMGVLDAISIDYAASPMSVLKALAFATQGGVTIRVIEIGHGAYSLEATLDSRDLTIDQACVAETVTTTIKELVDKLYRMAREKVQPPPPALKPYFKPLDGGLPPECKPCVKCGENAGPGRWGRKCKKCLVVDGPVRF